MVLPPATPAPSRFLGSKRQQSHSQTLNQDHANGPRQFHATPRFSASTPRPSSTQTGLAFTTPALAIKPRVPRSCSTQDIIDDTSPISSGECSPSASLGPPNTFPEPIEFESSLVPQSPSLDEGRSPKRRRISIASSEPGTDPITTEQQSGLAYIESLSDAGEDHIVSYNSDIDDESDTHVQDESPDISPTRTHPHIHLPTSSPNYPPSPSIRTEEESLADDSDPGPESDPESDAANSQDSDTALLKLTTRKPAFRSAPRFKPAEPPDEAHAHPDPYLADIFSPQRRGAKYFPGGLAAELRDWLVEAKGGVDGKGEAQATSSVLRFATAAEAATATATARVVVDEVSHGGPGMTLILGRLLLDAGGGEGVGFGSDGQEAGRVRVILAGEGTIEGLGGGRGGGNRGRVGPGAVVAITPPAWDVELDGRWAVAYRWEVSEGSGGGAG